MITLYIGNVGSGKTLSAVREIATNPKINYYTNIATSLKNSVPLTWDKIVQKKITGYKHKRDGTDEPVEELSLNKEFWMKAKRPLNIILDEAHNVLDSRRASTKQNIIMNNFGSLIRKFMGDSEQSEIILITQLSRRLDIVWKEMAHDIKHFRAYYFVCCNDCKSKIGSHSDSPIRYKKCFFCGSRDIHKSNLSIEVKCFAGLDKYYDYSLDGKNSFYESYMFNNPEKYFQYYKTEQIENLLAEF